VYIWHDLTIVLINLKDGVAEEEAAAEVEDEDLRLHLTK
jgi:hypothetical protein